MSQEIERASPDDFVAHYELLRMQINMVVPLLKRVAEYPCTCVAKKHSCVFGDARKFLDDIGVEY